MNELHLRIASMIAQHYNPEAVDKVLNQCPKDEYIVCSIICCPHEDTLHFHHDGCPSCAEHDQLD